METMPSPKDSDIEVSHTATTNISKTVEKIRLVIGKGGCKSGETISMKHKKYK